MGGFMPDRPPDEFDQTIRADEGEGDPASAPTSPDDGRTIAVGHDAGPDPDHLSIDDGATLRQSLHDGGGDGEGSAGSIEQRFEISDQLGEGGMGVVYKARDRRLGRMVALKRLKGDTKENKQTIERFWREARTIASLDHFNIVRIYNVFDDREGLWIEMELVEGGTLQELIDREGALSLDRVVEIGCQLCDALAISHFRGIIHRDIKPANVLLTDRGTPKLADFGLAHETEVDSKYTVTGALLGTMHYAAPEQMVSGKHVDERADIYALGATLYAAATGSSPRIVRLDQVPEELREIIAKCLEENPSARYAKMEALIAALREAVAEETRHGVARADVGCPKCEWENPPDVRFCQKCGEDLSSLFEKCPKCEREVASRVLWKS
jgi:eukaryotic-like serine/threonine-protein kinase